MYWQDWGGAICPSGKRKSARNEISALLSKYATAIRDQYKRSSFVNPYGSAGKPGVLYSTMRKAGEINILTAASTRMTGVSKGTNQESHRGRAGFTLEPPYHQIKHNSIPCYL